jgi:hypothetical protein
MAEDIRRRFVNTPLIKPALRALTKALKQNANELKKSKSTRCAHFLGYLKTRPKNSSIPDDCLTCRNIMKCTADRS